MPTTSDDHAPSEALSVDSALVAILSRMRPVGVELLSLEQAVGRTLADDVIADVTLPPWANSGMDGYAVLRDDVLGATAEHPRSLRVIATIAAGSQERPTISSGVCARIMTGAPLPAGADAVVRVEDTDRGVDTVRVLNDRDARTATGNVRPRGEDIASGATVALRGDVITPALLGVLASVGAAQVRVHHRPRVVLASGGDELVTVSDIDAVREGRAIVSSSSYALPALLEACGAEVQVLPLLPDDLDVMRGAIGRALEQSCDLLITTGGVSVGAFDHVRRVIRDLGGRIDVPRVRVRPGGPLGAGHVQGTPWIGLPGNPVSTLVTAEVFVRPAVRALAGQSRVRAVQLPVRLAEDVSAPAPFTFFLRARLSTAGDGVLEARLTGRQGSNLLTSMSRAHALLRIEGPQHHVPAGQTVPALLLEGALLESLPHDEAVLPSALPESNA